MYLLTVSLFTFVFFLILFCCFFISSLGWFELGWSKVLFSPSFLILWLLRQPVRDIIALHPLWKDWRWGEREGERALASSPGRQHKIGIIAVDYYAQWTAVSERFIHTGKEGLEREEKKAFHHPLNPSTALPRWAQAWHQWPKWSWHSACAHHPSLRYANSEAELEHCGCVRWGGGLWDSRGHWHCLNVGQRALRWGEG